MPQSDPARPPMAGTSQMLPRTNRRRRKRVRQLMLRLPSYAGGRGVNGRSSSCPSRMTP